MNKLSGMTVTPIRLVAMSSPSVTAVDSPPQMKTVTSRISNFSVASLLADTRSKTPPPPRIIANHAISLNNNNNNEICLTPKNLSTSHASSCSPSSPHNDSSNSLKQNDRERMSSHTPHSSIASEDYDDSLHEDDDDEDVDIECEDINGDNPAQKSSSGSLPPQSMIGGPHPIRPTPFSALAAAAAAWGGMNNGGWPGRQMPPFGPPGLFPAQGFPSQMNGGKFSS